MKKQLLIQSVKLHFLKAPIFAKEISIIKACSNATIFSAKLFLTILLLLITFSIKAQCPSPPGNPSTFGDNEWNAYVYDNNDLSLATAVYSGYYTQSTLGFNSVNSWNQNSSPSNTEGWTGCSVDSDAFTYVYKRKGFACGNYTITMAGWDDAAVVYVDGVALWSCVASSTLGSCSGYVGDMLLNENSEIEVRVREDGGDSFASLSLVNNSLSIAGTLIPSGSTTICAGTSPHPMTLSGFTGAIVKWQSAEDSDFTIGVTDISSSSNVLTPTDMGRIPSTRYYRAVVQDGSCYPEYCNPVQITVPAPVTYSGGLWSNAPTETTPVIIDDNLVLGDDLDACSCLVKNGKTLSVDSNVTLTVTTSVTVESGANLIVRDKGSLVQLEDIATNTGSISVWRNSQAMKNYDFTYWSSPVSNTTLFQVSPLTTADKYYRFNPISNSWVSIVGGAQVMVPGTGYIIRAPQGWSVTNSSSGVYSAEFKGIPNNGVIPVTIQKGASTFNLIGNPYPSAIDIDLFLTDPANTGIVNGTIYLWTHNTAISSTIPGNAIYNYTADDYAKYNLTGGIRTAATAITGGTIPDGKIASGQGFFIEAATGLANGTYTASFTNKMRVAAGNEHFYRTNPMAPSNLSALEKNRLWLNISNTQGAYNQILVGYITNATDGVDALFDGKTMAAGNVLSMYSIIGTDNFSIQGKALPFADNQSVVVGYKTTIAGDFTIALENFDGLFVNQDVYLLDKLNNTIQNLKTASYTFTSAIGTFNDRFEIRFTNSTLGIAAVTFNENNVLITTKENQVSVSAPSMIERIDLFDMLGRKVYSKEKINTSQFQTPELPLSSQVLIAKVKLTDFETSRKIILK